MIERFEKNGSGGNGGGLEQLVCSISDAAHMLGDVSENHIRNLVKDKHLDKVMIGRRTTITIASVRRLVEKGGTVNAETSVAA